MITERQPEHNDPNKQKHPPMYTSETEATLNDLLQKVPMTAEILFYKQQNSNINIQWINWAIEMLQAGYETENLIILAGEDIHCNPFEFTALTNKIFEELHLNKINITDRVFIIYSTYLIKQAVQSPNKEKISEVLFNAAIPLIAKNPEFKSLHEYYTTRANNPLKKKQSVIAISCKLIRVFYAILAKGVTYDAQKLISDIHRQPQVA